MFTRHLPGPLEHDPHPADRRRLASQRDRRLGGLRRGIPYGRAQGASAGSVLALVAGIVVATGWSLLVALLGRSPALPPGRYAAAARTVALTAVTATADGEGPAAAPAEPAMKSGNHTEPRQGRPPHAALYTTTRLCEACLG